MEIYHIVQEAVDKTIPEKKKCKKAEWLCEEALQRAEKRRKNHHKNSKNISRTSSGFILGIVGSVNFWLVPWSDLYFSRSIGPFLCSGY